VKGGIHKFGGGQQFYTGTTRDVDSPVLPMIGIGRNTAAISEAITPLILKQFESMRAGMPATELDRDAVNAALARVPDAPDEKLR
jgi:hypothetical protein